MDVSPEPPIDHMLTDLISFTRTVIPEFVDTHGKTLNQKLSFLSKNNYQKVLRFGTD